MRNPPHAEKGLFDRTNSPLPYHRWWLGEYSGGMLWSQATEMLFSPTTALWLAVAALAAVTLTSSLSRRRTGLSDALREFVLRQRGLASDETSQDEVVSGDVAGEAARSQNPEDGSAE